MKPNQYIKNGKKRPGRLSNDRKPISKRKHGVSGKNTSRRNKTMDNTKTKNLPKLEDGGFSWVPEDLSAMDAAGAGAGMAGSLLGNIDATSGDGVSKWGQAGSGLLTGAGTGFTVGGPIGAAVGGAIGGVGGLLMGNKAEEKREDKEEMIKKAKERQLLAKKNIELEQELKKEDDGYNYNQTLYKNGGSLPDPPDKIDPLANIDWEAFNKYGIVKEGNDTIVKSRLAAKAAINSADPTVNNEEAIKKLLNNRVGEKEDYMNYYSATTDDKGNKLYEIDPKQWNLIKNKYNKTGKFPVNIRGQQTQEDVINSIKTVGGKPYSTLPPNSSGLSEKMFVGGSTSYNSVNNQGNKGEPFSKQIRDKNRRILKNEITNEIPEDYFQEYGYKGANDYINQNMSHLKKYKSGGQLPIVNNYEGQSHEGPNQGIPVDKNGNPISKTGNKPVALTEGNEVSWNGYVFSDELEIEDD